MHNIHSAIDAIIYNFNNGRLPRKKNFFNVEFIKSKKINKNI